MSPRIPIRSKLALALAVPLAAVVVMATLQVQRAQDDTAAVRADADLALGIIGPGSVIRALQAESLDALTTITGLRSAAPVDTASFEESKAELDQAITEFRAGLASGKVTGAEIYEPVLDEIEDGLAEARARFDEVEQPYSLERVDDGRAIVDVYDPLVQELDGANAKLLNEIQAPELQEPVAVMNVIVRTKSAYVSLAQWAIFAELTDTVAGGPERDLVVASLERAWAARRELAAYAGPSELGTVVQTILDTPETRTMRGAVSAQLAGEPLDVTALVEAGAGADRGAGAETREATQAYLTKEAARLVDEAEATERRYLYGGAAVVLGALVLALLAARSITRPLRSLTRQAKEMAGSKLPFAVQQVRDTPLGSDIDPPVISPIEVKTRDEVQDVARALNQVQTSALDLAVEQAVMRHHIADTFVNLGRRTQNLINRQIDVITELEQEEHDPEALKHLFTLDHLATRARRNAESLVVLAGVEAPRTFTAPIPIRDVLLGCRSEVEGYERVKIVVIDDIAVPGGIAADLVHLLAELVENGLTCSPPDRSVEVVGRMTERGYVVGVVDQGIGMNDVELSRANARLAGHESYTVAPSRYLGHHVVGQLADRIGASVSLQEAPAGGIAARVLLPLDRLVEVPPAPPLELGEGDREAVADGPPSEAFDEAELAALHVEGRPPRPFVVAANGVANGATNGAANGAAGGSSNGAANGHAEGAGGPAPAEAVAPPARAATTPNGLTRRIPGAQKTPTPNPLSRGPVFPTATPATETERAEESAALLNDFTAGLARGRKEALAVADPIRVALASVTAIDAERADAARRPADDDDVTIDLTDEKGDHR